MAVNLSLRQIEDSRLFHDIQTVLRDSGMAPDLLELEITESMIMSNPKQMIAVLANIKNLGIRLSIDDFGTGYSSLSKLKLFPIDTLKIDRSFIRNIPKNAEDRAITQAIISIGESLGLTVIAEGVETAEQLDILKQQLCDEIQGFYFNKPTDAQRFTQFIAQACRYRVCLKSARHRIAASKCAYQKPAPYKTPVFGFVPLFIYVPAARPISGTGFPCAWVRWIRS